MHNLTFAIVILGWIALLLAGSKWIEYLWVRALGARPFRLFVAPGIIVHEYSHAIACLITGAKIHEIKLFKRDGGHVKHEKPKPSFLGIPFLMAGRRGSAVDLLKFNFFSQFMISFAPVVGCLACIWLMGIGLNAATGEKFSPVGTVDSEAVSAPALLASAEPASSAGASANSDVDAASVTREADDLGAFLKRFWDYLFQAFMNLFTPLIKMPLVGIVYLWLLLSFTIAMAPSERDFANSIFGLVLVVLVIIVISFALAQLENQAALQQIFNAILPMVAYTTAVMVFALVATTVLAAPLQALIRGRR